MMSWIAIVAGFSIILLLIKKWLQVKEVTLGLRQKHQDAFFLVANELYDSGHLRDHHTIKIAMLSRLMGKFAGQMIATTALMEVVKEEREARAARMVRPAEVSTSADLSSELQAKWREMYFHWLVATCSQGAILGLGSILRLLEFLDHKDAGAQAEAKINLSAPKSV